MPPTDADVGGLASVLKDSRAGTFTLPISRFIHTTSGRLLRRAGIDDLYADIKQKGWLTTSLPTVCLVGDVPEGGLTADNADSRQYRMIDGNHRLAAIRLLEKEPDSCAPAVIGVDVHAGKSKDTEKHIALSEPVVVKSFVSLCFICLRKI